MIFGFYRKFNLLMSILVTSTLVFFISVVSVASEVGDQAATKAVDNFASTLDNTVQRRAATNYFLNVNYSP